MDSGIVGMNGQIVLLHVGVAMFNGVGTAVIHVMAGDIVAAMQHRLVLVL